MHSLGSVLCVDDNTNNLQILSQLLEHAGYQVRATPSGEFAIKALEVFHPEVILLDIRMPGLDGFETCRRIKAHPHHRIIPILFLSASQDNDDRMTAFQVGAADFISKPFLAEEVLARVNVHAQLYKMNQNLEQLVEERTKELHSSWLEILNELGRAAEYRDNETGHHIIRVGLFCYLIARAFGLHEEDAITIRHASAMHDVGKIGIPDHILLKPGKLTPEEFDIIKIHPEVGADIINKDVSPLLYAAHVCALTHHERWDGTGYPNGLKGEAIPLFGRIVALADVFDALTTVRPYKDAWSNESAIEYINKGRNSHFQTEIVDAFLNCLPKVIEVQKQYRN